jgi:hypothetical protein
MQSEDNFPKTNNFRVPDASLATAALPTFNDIGYLAKGYNIVKGNPHTTPGNYDPGFSLGDIWHFE